MARAQRHNRRGKGECTRCGFIYPLKQLSYEWTNNKVCPACWDPLPAQIYPRRLEAEQTGLHDPRPRNDKPAGHGLIRGEWEIIGREWLGTDLGITGGEATLS